jgi:polysaccharide biosynthesis/export protein ExoF
MLRRIGILALAFSVIGGGTPAPAQEVVYKLGIMDRVRVHVHEWPALTGEFSVGANGDITVPMIGPIPASGLQPVELARAIGARLKAKVELSQAPDTSVDIIQYRPFYILGQVERPGEYSFRPGMVVLNAVSISGGLYRPPRPTGVDWGPQRDAIAALGDIRLTSSRRIELEARRLRLEAETKDAMEFPAPPADASPDFLAQLEREKITFTARLDRLKNQETSNTATVGLLEAEIDAVNAQIGALDRHKDSVQKELDDTRVNVNKGILPAPRLLPIERTVHQIEAEQKALQTSIMRARQQINLSRALSQTQRDERRASAAADLVLLKQQFQEMEERYRTAVGMVSSSAEAMDGDSVDSQEQAAIITYTVIRTISGKTVELAAGETTVVQPGDIVKVARIAARAQERRSSEATGAVVPATKPLATLN